MTTREYNVLFICTGNTARSILAEAILRRDGAGKFKSYSAGSTPKGIVNPFALKVLKEEEYPIEGLYSKSWKVFEEPNAPSMDFIFTVCDSAAQETCPHWAGHPVTAHWGIEDPAAVEGTDVQKLAAFYKAFRYLRNRIQLLLALPIDQIDRSTITSRLAEIGKSTD